MTRLSAQTQRHALTIISAIALVLLSTSQPSALDVQTQLFTNDVTSPVFLTAPPGDQTRILVVQRDGQVILFKNGIKQATPFLDHSDSTLSGDELGMLGLAFHPDYPDSPYVYICYTADGIGPSGHSRISRFNVMPSLDQLDASSEQIRLTLGQPQPNHNGGMIAFGPNDGYLYIGFGDGGGSGDNHGTIGNGQDPETLHGKMIRIDINTASNYAIPSTNPFFGATDTLDEIWDFGVRNPWRWSFDPANGNMYIADVGQGAWEEINLAVAPNNGGTNWGWRLREGKHCFNPPSNCDPQGITTDPVYEYSHSAGRCSITGGYVYRGSDIPAAKGRYFFADYCTGEVWSGEKLGATFTDIQLHTNIDNVTSFGVDASGELYVCELDGDIYKFIPAPPCCDLAGDADNNGSVNIGDVTFIIARIFGGGVAPDCQDEADANSTNTLNIGDATYLIARIFSGGPAPICGTTGT